MLDKQHTTTQELYDLLKDGLDEESGEGFDSSNLRYFLYARKSTTGEDRQERSIEDQITDCMERVIKPAGLQVVAVIEEKYSAKEPDTRPKFRAMINDIKAGKANGIISWHPDRLSRNMKEAGEIIDLVDKSVIRDLKFATSTFENTPTGKMTLGISFVLSKQYSEHLSESVTRGNRRKTEDGRYLGKFKHGYYIDEYRRLIPDGENLAVIREVFERRLSGQTQVDIVKWLNGTYYTIRRYQKQPERYVWDKDAVSKVLRDPTYAGVLKYGKHLVNLSEHYEFEPIVKVEDFLKINKISTLKSDRLVSSFISKNPRTTKANLLRGVVFCGFCKKPFSSSITSKRLKDEKRHYYYYRCETEDCEFRNRGVRAGVIVRMASEFFDTYQFTTQDNYDQFIDRAMGFRAKRIAYSTSRIASLSKQIDIKQREYDGAKKTILQNPDLKAHYDLDEIQKEIKTLGKKLDKRVEYRKKLQDRDTVYEYKNYLKLLSSASVTIPKMHDIAQMDDVIRIFFSNFYVRAYGVGKKQRYEIDYKLKEPWQGFLENGNFVYGRGERTQTFDLSVPNRARYQLRHTPIGVFT